MALFIHTTGVLSKLLSEAVEAIEPGLVEGIRATGANKIEILYGVLPQVMPLLISPFPCTASSPTFAPPPWSAWWRRRHWRHPVEAIRGFQFQQTCALMVLIIVTVSLWTTLSTFAGHFI